MVKDKNNLFKTCLKEEKNDTLKSALKHLILTTA